MGLRVREALPAGSTLRRPVEPDPGYAGVGIGMVRPKTNTQKGRIPN